MLCDRCHQNEATIHIQEVTSAGKREVNLCSACAAEQGMIPAGTGDEVDVTAVIYSMTSKALDAATPDAEAEEPRACAVCESCGMREDEFAESGRLGCAHCYDAFRARLVPMLASLHRGSEHVGVAPCAPAGAAAPQPGPDLPGLQQELERAVASEAYERAAELRDEIRRRCQPESES